MNKSLLMAAAMAGLMLSACSSTPKTEGDAATKTGDVAVGECNGANSCKGKGACGGAGHGCAGKNACKGQGWLKLSKAECDSKGGKFKAN